MNEKTISHYNILRHVSNGVGGRVYQAEDTILQRKVALKFLPQQLTGDADASRRFLREARATSNIDHPNICNIHEIGETDDGDFFIAMTWYSGGNLKEHLVQEKPSVIRSLDFACQITRGLARAHENGVIHRDIKPSNIIVTKHRELKIVDFGLARLLNKARLTNEGTVLGTASYMSPEQARGEDAVPASDLWSVGVILYEMLAGERPFKGDHEVAVLYSVLNSDPDPLAMGACPEGCQCRTIIKRCLDKDISKRYQTAQEMLVDLENALVVAKEHQRKNSLAGLIRDFAFSIGKPARFALGMMSLVLMTQIFPMGRDLVRNVILGFEEAPCNGVAVLPFTFVGGTPEEQALANGLSWFTADAISRIEGQAENFWLVPPGTTQEEGINSGQDAQRLLGIGCTISGNGRIQGDQILLRLTINNTLKDQQVTHTIDDNLSNLKSWQVDLPRLLVRELSPELENSVEQSATSHMTNVPGAFRDYLTGSGYAHAANNDNNYPLAMEYFNRAVFQDSSFACSLAQLGFATWKASDGRDSTQLAKAAQLITMATVLHPDHSRAWVLLGNVLDRQGKTDEARLAFNQALSLNSISEGALHGLWDLEMNAGNTEIAFEHLTLAMEARPNYFNTIDNFGVHQYYQGNFVDAETSFRHLVKIAPQQNRGFILLGATLFAQDKYPESEVMFENSLAIDPTYTAYSNLATLYFYSGRMHDSIDMSVKALSLDDTRYHAWRTLGESYYWTPGLRDSSKTAFEKCVFLLNEDLEGSPIKESSKNQVLRSDLASCHVRLGENEIALNMLDELAQESNLGVPVMFNLASSYEEMNNRGQALYWLEKAVAADLSMAQVERYPGLRNLRTHPRFLALRHKYGKE